jgi:hypothetical protein
MVVLLQALNGDDDPDAEVESDASDTQDLCFEISARMRQIAKILNRHAEPKMNVPDGMADENGNLDVERKQVFELGETGVGANYLELKSELGQAFAEVDKIVDLIMLLTDTPGALWGRDKDGQADSGKALKFKLLTGLGKARRSGAMLKSGLTEAARLALRREDALAGRTPGEYAVTVALSETFIADETETIDKVQKLRVAGVMSIERAVEVGQGLTGEDRDSEVAAIQAETPAAPLGFQGGA